MTIRVFVSYSHRDADYLSANSLLGHLRGLGAEGVEFWYDEALIAGEAWDDEIKQKIDGSDIALVLVSQLFLDSAYCAGVEIPRFLENAKANGLVVFPVILSACEWDRHPWLRTLQVFPGKDETIEEHYTDAGKKKRLFLRIREDLRAQIARIRKERKVQSRQLLISEMLNDPAYSTGDKLERSFMAVAGFSIVDKLIAFGIPMEEPLELDQLMAVLSGDRITPDLALELQDLVNVWSTGYDKFGSGR